jgi:hypothetical protein
MSSPTAILKEQIKGLEQYAESLRAQLAARDAHTEDCVSEIMLWTDKVGKAWSRINQLEADLEEREAQLAVLKQFAQWAIKDGPWNGCHLDGFEIQEKAVELGLVEKRIANEMNADEWRDIDGVEEIGDTFYVFTEATRQPTQDKGEL